MLGVNQIDAAAAEDAPEDAPAKGHCIECVDIISSTRTGLMPCVQGLLEPRSTRHVRSVQ